MHMFHEHRLFTPHLPGWRSAGEGTLRTLDAETVETVGGSGIVWYKPEIFENFVLKVRWRVMNPTDNSGVFIRCPPLADDPQPAIDRGYEIQIDERGFDPERELEDSPLHRSGAIYKVAPATAGYSRPVGEWNDFDIMARGATIEVRLNGTCVCSMDDASREPRGHIGLQTHHPGSKVQFQALSIRRLLD